MGSNPLLKKKQIIFTLLLVLFLWWFIGGGYFSDDPSDPVIGMKIRFSEQMEEVSPVPKILMGKEIRKKYKRAIVTSSTLKRLVVNGLNRVETTPLPKDEKLYIKNVIHLKHYGFFASSFRVDTSYYLIQDNKGKEFIFSIEDNYELFQ